MPSTSTMSLTARLKTSRKNSKMLTRKTIGIANHFSVNRRRLMGCWKLGSLGQTYQLIVDCRRRECCLIENGSMRAMMHLFKTRDISRLAQRRAPCRFLLETSYQLLEQASWGAPRSIIVSSWRLCLPMLLIRNGPLLIWIIMVVKTRFLIPRFSHNSRALYFELKMADTDRATNQRRALASSWKVASQVFRNLPGTPSSPTRGRLQECGGRITILLHMLIEKTPTAKVTNDLGRELTQC